MKKIIFLFIACVVQLCAQAQVPTQDPYPNTVAAATQINKYSFFVDSVSNVNEQPLAFAAALTNTTAGATINLAGVATGLHQLYAQVIATNGVPSITNLGNFYMEGSNVYTNAPAPATQINKYSFFVDSVSNVNEQPLVFAAANNNATPTTSINLAGVTTGLHQLYAQVMATNGVPSITNLGNFYMEGSNVYTNTPAPATQINKYSFYIDSVSSVNEQPLAFAAANNNATPTTSINLAGVTPGVHQLYAQVIATNGVPSIINLGNFFMSDNNLYPNAPAAANAINRYEFYIDSVTTTNIQPLAFTTALQNNTPSTNISLLNVQPGIHQLYARVFTVNNIESIVNLGQFAMEQNFRYANVAASAPALQNMEYYIDVDPGYGLATAISISGANITEVLNNINISIPNNLTAGTHFLHVRSKQNPWSIDNALPFNVGVVVPVTWLYVRAQLLNDNSLIQWATSTEINSLLYNIEWSTNGTNFIKIGAVNAAGNTSSTSTYNFTHDRPANGFNYYRIKQIDVDGRFKYSDIVKVLQKQNKAISFYPNPATTCVQIELAGNKKTLVQIFDAQGKQVIILNSSNQALLKIDIAALAKGNYILQASDGEVWYTGSFIKQ